jgi:hypothetical protein
MGKINYGRVIVGGIVGGILAASLDWFFNGVLLGQRWDDTVTALNHPGAFTASPVTFLVGLYLIFIVGNTLIMWLYAAVRPRLGAGMRTAVYVGLVTWVFGFVLPNTSWALIGLFGRRLLFYNTLAGIVEVVVGAVVGAALYKEAVSVPANYPVTAGASPSAR